MRRRALLASLAVSGFATAGCLQRTGSDSGTESRPTRSDPETDAPASTETYTPTDIGTAVRARGDPITVEKTAEDGPGSENPDVEFFPGNRTVRFPKYRTSDGPAGYEMVSFEQWALFQGSDIGIDRVRTVTAQRLGTDAFGSGFGQPPEGVDEERSVITLTVRTQRENGEKRPPDLSLGRLADHAPRAVTPAITIEGETVTRTIPVYATHGGPVQFLDEGGPSFSEATVETAGTD